MHSEYFATNASLESLSLHMLLHWGSVIVPQYKLAMVSNNIKSKIRRIKQNKEQK